MEKKSLHRRFINPIEEQTMMKSDADIRRDIELARQKQRGQKIPSAR